MNLEYLNKQNYMHQNHLIFQQKIIFNLTKLLQVN